MILALHRTRITNVMLAFAVFIVGISFPLSASAASRLKEQ